MYSLVARGSVVFAEHTSSTGNFQQVFEMPNQPFTSHSLSLVFGFGSGLVAFLNQQRKKKETDAFSVDYEDDPGKVVGSQGGQAQLRL